MSKAALTITAPKRLPSIDRLNELLTYDPESGILRWRVTRGNTARAGAIAGSLTARGYRGIAIDCRRFWAHRIAFKMGAGRDPKGGIDHVNGRKYDNRLVNLREATRQQNAANSKKRKHNTSGFKGVYWIERTRRWRASIHKDRKHIHIGYFDKPEEAHAAYCKAAQRHFGKFARIK